MSDYDTIANELTERLRESARLYQERNANGTQALHCAVLEELIRIELRMRALAGATLAAASPTLPGTEIADTLRSLAEGSELP